ncbi:MAG: hypothetical protein KDB00_15800, partial [Planctomycetales bacterium]|nr:hypothetical protein [Planctomycetales bacterium]
MKRLVLHGQPIVGQQVDVATNASSDAPSEIPSSFYAHFSGEVGSTGRASSTAMENYSGVVVSAIDDVLAAARLEAQDHGFEMMVSLAVLPNATRLIQIETVPSTNVDRESDARADMVRLMTQKIESIAMPDVQDGPVAFVVYRRVNLDAVNKLGVKPFSRFQDSIEKLGLDEALTLATQQTNQTQNLSPARVSRWRVMFDRVRRVFSKPAKVQTAPPPQTPEDKYQNIVAWIEYTNDRFERMSDAELQHMLRRSPTELALHVAVAERYARKENREQTIDAYSGAIALAPDWAPLLGRRGLQHLMAGNHQAALVDLNNAIHLAPFSSWFYFHRSKIFTELDAWEPTLADLDKAIELAPREPVFRFRRAEIQIHLENSERALDDLGRILKLDPHNGASHAMLGWLHQQEDLRNEPLAHEHLSHAIELMPGEIAPWIHRSMLYASQNKFELALDDCDHAIEINKEQGHAHALRGRILQMQGEFDDAIQSCNRA